MPSSSESGSRVLRVTQVPAWSLPGPVPELAGPGLCPTDELCPHVLLPRPAPATPHSGLGASSPSPHGHCPGAGGFCVARNALPPSDSPNESRGRCLLFSPHTSCYGDGVATQSHLPAAQPPCGLLCARGLAEGLSHRVLGSRTCDYVWPWASSRWLQLRRVPGVGDLRTAPTLMTMTTLAPPTSAGSGPV